LPGSGSLSDTDTSWSTTATSPGYASIRRSGWTTCSSACHATGSASELSTSVLVFRYPPAPAGEHPRPYVELELCGPNGQPLRAFGLIDTGADYSTLPLDAARQLGVSIYELETFEADDASGSLELGVARDPVSATLASRSFELRPRYVMSGDGAVDESGPLWGRRDFLRFWDFWLSERDERFALEWRSEA
jgi:hypothetical protein